MAQKIEGTLLLEGLIEGPLPPFPDALEKLEKWAARQGRFRMTVQGDAGRFSVLPGGEAIELDGAAEGAAQLIAEALGELLGLFPPMERGQIFSTLRSTEWRHKLEIRTIYTVGPDGRAATHQERSPAQTTAPAQRLEPRQVLARAGIGLLIAAALIGLSALFIDYPKTFRRLTATTEAVQVAVNEGNFSPYLRVEIKTIDRRSGMLGVRLTRTALYPLTDLAIDGLYAHPALPAAATQRAASEPATRAGADPAGGPGAVAPAAAPGLVRRRMAVEAIARGTIHLEFHDGKGHFLGEVVVRTAGLQDADSLETEVAAPAAGDALVVPESVTLRP